MTSGGSPMPEPEDEPCVRALTEGVERLGRLAEDVNGSLRQLNRDHNALRARYAKLRADYDALLLATLQTTTIPYTEEGEAP